MFKAPEAMFFPCTDRALMEMSVRAPGRFGLKNVLLDIFGLP